MTITYRHEAKAVDAAAKPSVFVDSHGFFGNSRASNLALSASICAASSSSDIVRTGPVRCTA